MNILVTIILLGCICGSRAHDESRSIERRLEENTKELIDIHKLLRHIDVTYDDIKSTIQQQRVWLETINNVEARLVKLTLVSEAQGLVVLDAVKNLSLTSDLNVERVAKELGVLTRLQLSTKQQIGGLEQKLDAYQKHVLQNARSIDNNILELTKLITRAVLPQLNGLQCSFDSLETSQINIEVELKSLPRIKEASEATNAKLILLSEQLVQLNRTQDARLSTLSHILAQLKPLNTWQIESALRELIISQKRIELDLEVCEKHASQPHSSKPPSSDAYPVYELESPAPPSHPQVDRVPAWNVQEQNQQNLHSGSHYAAAPEPKPQPRPAKPSNPGHSHHAAPHGQSEREATVISSSAYSVSWQQPLPWETVSPFQPAHAVADAPKPKPHQPTPVRRRPSPNHPHNPPRHSAPARYGPPAPAPQSHAPQGNKHAPSKPQERHSIWYGAPNSQADGY